MSPRKRPSARVGEEHHVTIESLAYGGKGVAHLGDAGKPGMAVFVSRSAPGDRARIRVNRVRRRHAEASVTAIEAPGPGRVEPPCPHYGEGCGGCSWQHLDYATQLAAKEQMVRDSLHRIGEFADVPIAPIVAADTPWFYRNKMEFSFHAQDGLGLHVGGDWRHVVPITDCRLESELAMKIVAFARDFAAQHDLSAWDPAANEGFLREVVIRHGRGSDEVMVGLVTERGAFDLGGDFAAGVAALDPSIVSVVRAVRGSFEDGAPIEDVHALHGRDTIVERVGGLAFNIGLQTFFQTSTAQAERMLSMVREEVAGGFASGNPTLPSRVLDVFCGVGFFTLGLADLAREAIGVEIVEPSIVAARENARINGIDNCHFYAGDARRTLPVVLEQHGAPGVAVIDPPRSGAGGKVMRRLARSGPWRLVYVSCNPTTLARDLKEMHPFGYRLQSVRPIDLFPQTYHVETIVVMDRLAEPDPETLRRRG
jgi:23S rRNA (uracil1939-C5)-methyltransferase